MKKILTLLFLSCCLSIHAQRFVQSTPNVASLVQLNPLNVQSNVMVLGYTTANDGGGGMFYPTNTVVGTNLNYLIASAAYPGWSWKRLNETIPNLTVLTNLNVGGPVIVTNSVSAPTFNASTGFEIGGTAASGHYLRGNGANYVDGTISAGDVTFSGTQYGVSYYVTASTLGSTLAGTSTTLLHGNAAGAPTWSSVSLTADVSGQLPIANGGTGSGTLAGAGIVTGAGSGAANRVAFWTGANSLSSDPNLTFFYSNSTPVFSSLGNVWVGTNDADHVFAVYGHTNNLAGFESDGTDSNSMLHIKNTGVQGPFFDFWSSNQRWAWGNASGGNFVLRNSGVGTDPVNGTTIAEFVPTGGIIDRSLTAGRVTFAGISGLLSDDSNFVWDNTNKRLGIGMTPTVSAEVNGQIIAHNYVWSIAADDAQREIIAQNSVGTYESGVFAVSGIALSGSTTSGKDYQLFAGGANRWTITSTGILQANGPQTIQTSSGALTLQGGSSGNINLNPSGGNVVVGAASTSAKCEVAGTVTGQTNPIGLKSGSTFDSSSTGFGSGIVARPQTAAASFTIANLASIYADPTSNIRGAGSTITSMYGLYIENATAGAVNNYGIYVKAPSGGSGINAAAVFDGNVGIGTTGPLAPLVVQSTPTGGFSQQIRLTDYLGGDSVRGAAIEGYADNGPGQRLLGRIAFGMVDGSGDPALKSYVRILNVYNSTEQVGLCVAGPGNVGIGTTTPDPYSKLTVSGVGGILVSGDYSGVPASAGLALDYHSSGPYGRISVADGSGGWTKNLAIQPYGGNVLVGSTADTGAGQKLQVTGVTLSTAGFGSHSVTTGSPTSTGWTNSTTVNQILYVTAATGASLTDNAGNTEFSGVTIANFTPVRIQPNGAFVGTGVTYATGSGAHAW